jgi:4-oxalocrotonate tautomerase
MDDDGEGGMPFAKVHVPAGVLTADQRREIVKGIHDVINRVQNRPPDQPVSTYVLIDEVPAEGWGRSGTLLAPKS